MFEGIRHTIVWGGKTRDKRSISEGAVSLYRSIFLCEEFFIEKKNDITLTSFFNAEMFDYYSVLNSSVVDNVDWSCELAVLQCRKTGYKIKVRSWILY